VSENEVPRRNVYRILVRKAQGKRKFWRPRKRLTENIKMDLQHGVMGLDSTASR
jgi:hypothetical protein